MCSFFKCLFIITGNNNAMYSKNRIGNRYFVSNLRIIVFQINSISLIESEEFRKTSIGHGDNSSREISYNSSAKNKSMWEIS